MADPHRKGHQPSKVGTNIWFCQISEKLHEVENFWAMRLHPPPPPHPHPHPPSPPPRFGCATGKGRPMNRNLSFKIWLFYIATKYCNCGPCHSNTMSSLHVFILRWQHAISKILSHLVARIFTPLDSSAIYKGHRVHIPATWVRIDSRIYRVFDYREFNQKCLACRIETYFTWLSRYPESHSTKTFTGEQ